jgi:DNA-directed RNA polymerase subunit RPC12/RpoP
MEILEKPEGYCPRCGASFEFDKSDVKRTDGKGTPYIECPGCGSMLNSYEKFSQPEIWKAEYKTILILVALMTAAFYIGYLFGRL